MAASHPLPTQSHYELLAALRHALSRFLHFSQAEARAATGAVQAVAEQAHLNPTQLYRTLSPKGNPALSSLSAILKAMGMRLAVQPLPTPAQAA